MLPLSTRFHLQVTPHHLDPHEGTGLHIVLEEEDGLSPRFHGTESIPCMKQVHRIAIRLTGAAIPLYLVQVCDPNLHCHFVPLATVPELHLAPAPICHLTLAPAPLVPPALHLGGSPVHAQIHILGPLHTQTGLPHGSNQGSLSHMHRILGGKLHPHTLDSHIQSCHPLPLRNRPSLHPLTYSQFRCPLCPHHSPLSLHFQS